MHIGIWTAYIPTLPKRCWSRISRKSFWTRWKKGFSALSSQPRYLTIVLAGVSHGLTDFQVVRKGRCFLIRTFLSFIKLLN
jgi:hypothetical protein